MYTSLSVVHMLLPWFLSSIQPILLCCLVPPSRFWGMYNSALLAESESVSIYTGKRRASTTAAQEPEYEFIEQIRTNAREFLNALATVVQPRGRMV